jgi:membrane associated rhomboid family serine protease
MHYAPVGIKCPEHAAVGAVKPSAQRTFRQAKGRVKGLDAPVTMILVAINVIVYLITVAQGSGLNVPGGQVFNDGVLQGAAIAIEGDWYRLISSMFLHGSIIHLAFNMLALYWLGTVVEEALGAWRFALIYFVSGIAGSAGALLLSTPFQTTVGASGAIYGILGALLVLEYLSTGSFAGQAMGLIVINLLITVSVPNISLGGHLGGLVGGIAATFALMHFRHSRNRALGPALVVLIGIASVVVAYVRVNGYGTY